MCSDSSPKKNCVHTYKYLYMYPVYFMYLHTGTDVVLDLPGVKNGVDV